MRTVKLNRIELLDIVKKNKQTHITEFRESVIDFKKAVVKITKDNLVLAKTGKLEKIKEIKSIPQKPTSYEDDYTKAIRMLELSVDDNIELENDIFDQLVLDEWSWKKSFSVSNAMYKSVVG